MEHGCQYCYYEDFNEYAYPCSMCIYGVSRRDMFAPKGRRTKDEPKEMCDRADGDCKACWKRLHCRADRKE